MDSSTFQERAERLQAQIDGPEPQSWQPRDPELGHPQLLIGELVGVTIGHTRDWGEKQIAVVRDAGGTLWSVWLMHTTLVDEFHRQQPVVGEALAIRYEGRIEKPGAKPYEKYRLVVDRKGASVEWRSVDGNGNSETAAAAEPQPVETRPFAGAPAEPQTPAPAQDVETDICPECGYARGRHADSCSNDIPF